MPATKKTNRKKSGQSMVEMLLLTGLLATVVVLVKTLVLGGEGSVGWVVMGHFESQISSQVDVGNPKATMGGRPSWNYYYLDRSPSVSVK